MIRATPGALAARGSRAFYGLGMVSPSFGLVGLIDLGLLLLVGWALVDAVTRPAAAFLAAGKQTKPIWLAILGVCLLLCLIGAAGIFGLFGFVVAVAAIVYLVDVRPAVRAMRPGGPWS
ncbi:MAG: hypothetical protein NVSMB55_15770 [Mycobacteriales bacterium]